MSTPQRPPFDVADADIAAAYMRERNLTIVDPFTESRATEDVILTTSLSTTRFLMAQSFGAVRMNGQTYRAYPFIVGKPTANAFALEREGLQLCGLDIGLGTAAFEISLFVFSQSSLFTEIGNAAIEISPSLPTGSQLAFWISDRLRERGLPDGPPVGIELIPKDPHRQLAAYFLTQLMLRFVWLHEHYHCLNGHTGFLASQRRGIVLNEMPDETAIELIEIETRANAQTYERLRHAMEYDADRSALWMLVRLQQIDLEPVSGLSALPKPLRLKLAIFAAAMMTFMFDQAARRQTQLTTATHPAAQYRLVDLVRTLASNLVEPTGEVKQAFQKSLNEMTALQPRLPEFISATRLMEDVRSTRLQRELDEIDDALTSARQQLQTFAYRAKS